MSTCCGRKGIPAQLQGFKVSPGLCARAGQVSFNLPTSPKTRSGGPAQSLETCSNQQSQQSLSLCPWCWQQIFLAAFEQSWVLGNFDRSKESLFWTTSEARVSRLDFLPYKTHSSRTHTGSRSFKKWHWAAWCQHTATAVPQTCRLKCQVGQLKKKKKTFG